MAVSQVLINIGRYNLRRRNRLDYRGWAACTVPSCKYARHILKCSRTLGENLTPFYRYSCFFKMASLNILSDCDNQNIAWYVNIILSRGLDACPAVANRAYHLWFHIDSLNMVLIIDFNGGWRLQCLKLNPFCNRPLNFSRKRRHISNSPPVNNTYLLRAETFCCTYSVHGDIAAADDCNLLAGQIHNLVSSYIS